MSVDTDPVWTPVHRVLRWIRTYRQFRPSQLAGRAVAGLRRWLSRYRVPTAPDGLYGGLSPATDYLAHDSWNSAVDLREDRVCFLNESRSMGRPWDWTAEDMPLLWRFHLHYFDYLHLLDETERRDLCRRWIAAHPMGRGVGWHPYPTSLRIVNWCKYLGAGAPPDVEDSLYQQGGYLARNLEAYLSGNHLLENARALAFAGCYFGDAGEAGEWLEKGLGILRRELPAQVLADGGHYERSPMYHGLVLEACLDLLNVLPGDRQERALLRETAGRMLGFLRGVTHPDGCIALFNDAAVDGVPSPGRLYDYAHRIGGISLRRPEHSSSIETFPQSGFYRYREEPFTLMLDAGTIGPSHQPAHGHAGCFSYELSVRDRRVVTDTGVHSYAPGKLRGYCRGTRSHNTVAVDGVDQAEMWGAFRVARRFEPRVDRVELADTTFRFSGEFDGYADLVGDDIVHRRELRCDGPSKSLRVRDRLLGRGRHCAVSRLHLHPDIAVFENGPGQLGLGGTEFEGTLTFSGEVRHERRPYFPRFGVRVERSVICFRNEGQLPLELRYELSVE